MLGKMPGESLEVKARNLRLHTAFIWDIPERSFCLWARSSGRFMNGMKMMIWTGYPSVPGTSPDAGLREGTEWILHQSSGMYQEDYYPDGFQWINCTYHEESLAMFIRRTKKPEETLLFVCNFDNMTHEGFRVGVPFYGKYKEVLSSEDEKFGGEGSANPRVKTAKAIEWDGRDYSIEINIPAMSTMIFTCTPLEEEKPKKTVRKTEKAPGKKAVKTAEKTEAPKTQAQKEAPAKKGASGKTGAKKRTGKEEK